MSKQEALIDINALQGEYTFNRALEAEGGPSEVDQYHHEEPTLWENLCDRYEKRALQAVGIVIGVAALMGIVDALDGKVDGKLNLFLESAKAAGPEPPGHNLNPDGISKLPLFQDNGCQDSDATEPPGVYPRGINSGVKGIVTCSVCGPWTSYTDFCEGAGAQYLSEMYCKSPTFFGQRLVRCENDGAVCEDGRCVHKVLLPLVLKESAK